MQTIIVRPGETEIKLSIVALWDQDPEHISADARWQEFGGAFIAGDPAKPEATYKVALTGEVVQAIKKGRLVKVDDNPYVPPDYAEALAQFTEEQQAMLRKITDGAADPAAALSGALRLLQTLSGPVQAAASLPVTSGEAPQDDQPPADDTVQPTETPAGDGEQPPAGDTAPAQDQPPAADQPAKKPAKGK